MNCPSAAGISIPWLTASSANFMASGALAMIFCANFSAAGSKLRRRNYLVHQSYAMGFWRANGLAG